MSQDCRMPKPARDLAALTPDEKLELIDSRVRVLPIGTDPDSNDEPA